MSDTEPSTISLLRTALAPCFGAKAMADADEDRIISLVCELVERDLMARRFRSAIQRAVNTLDAEIEEATL